MSAHEPDAGAADGPAAGPVDGAGDERYAALHVEDGEMVIYDQRNHRAWLQSDHAVGLDVMV